MSIALQGSEAQDFIKKGALSLPHQFFCRDCGVETGDRFLERCTACEDTYVQLNEDNREIIDWASARTEIGGSL